MKQEEAMEKALGEFSGDKVEIDINIKKIKTEGKNNNGEVNISDNNEFRR